MNTWRHRLAVAGMVVVVAPIIVAAIIAGVVIWPLCYVAMIPARRRHQRFLAEYREYLKEIDGTEFFCYTNRKTSMHFVEESIVPQLGERTHAILLEGRDPQTEFDKRFISHALTGLRNHTVPCVMRATGGQMLDSPLHDELYGVISGRDTVDGFLRALNEKLADLREIGGEEPED